MRRLPSKLAIPRKTFSARRGITLLEVLISIFVASVGLLGLAALIPVGRSITLDAAKNDRGAACGRAAFRELKVRGLLDPAMLFAGSGHPAPITQPCCIDPLFIEYAQYSGNTRDFTTPISRGWFFPAALDNDPPTTGASPITPPRFLRLELAAWPGSAVRMPYAAVERIFRSSDDMVFDLPDDETLRPQPVWNSNNQMQSNGDYTWLATVVPQPWPLPAGTIPSSFSVSIAVFYKRQLLASDQNIANRTDGPPTERYVYADFLSAGITGGGGDVRLRLPIVPPPPPPPTPPANAGTPPEQSDFPVIKPNTWLMLVGWFKDTTNTPRPTFAWYRIVSVSTRTDGQNGPEFNSSGPQGSEWFYDVTLTGPDWDPTILDSNNQFAMTDADANAAVYTYPTAYAAVFENVIAVYTKTIEADSWAMP